MPKEHVPPEVKAKGLALKKRVQEIVEEKGMTLKEVAERCPMSYNGIHDKFRRGSITVLDLEKILDVLGMKLAFVPKSENKSQRK